MQYFSACRTIEEVKALYKKLAFENHPDLGGNTVTMQAINAEYAFATAHILKGADLSQEETENQMRFSEAYRELIEKIIHLPGIVVELVGLWIWVTGNTFPLRDQLKAAGLLFAPKKKAWYYRSEEYKVSRGGKKSLDEIRDKYGSEVIAGQPFRRQALS